MSCLERPRRPGRYGRRERSTAKQKIDGALQGSDDLAELAAMLASEGLSISGDAATADGGLQGSFTVSSVTAWAKRIAAFVREAAAREREQQPP